jgi:hypothetical protein
MNKIIVFEDKFFILDRTEVRKVLVFQSNGKFSHTIGLVGQGPGEYTNIEDFTIDKEKRRLIILCYPSIVNIYDLDGKFIERKRISEYLLWHISDCPDGYLCSADHQSAPDGNEDYLIFHFDKEFNFKDKLLYIPSFKVGNMSPLFNPLENDGDKMVYFDFFTSTLYYNFLNQTEMKTVYFDFGQKAVPAEYFSDPMKFFEKQQEYCFFIYAKVVDGVLWALYSFQNKGAYALFMDLETGKKLSFKMNRWFPDFFSHQDTYLYSAIFPDQILDGHNWFTAKTITKYPIEPDSNPVILRFKAKQILR